MCFLGCNIEWRSRAFLPVSYFLYCHKLSQVRPVPRQRYVQDVGSVESRITRLSRDVSYELGVTY